LLNKLSVSQRTESSKARNGGAHRKMRNTKSELRLKNSLFNLLLTKNTDKGVEMAF